MKNSLIILTFLAFTGSFAAQISGNINFKGNANYSSPPVPAGNVLNTPHPNQNEILISVKGMANVKADAYVAVFSVTQAAKTQEEANRLINERIGKALETLKNKPGVQTYVDMISFVPTYEFEVQKKIFSRKTYNEIPAGFELKKNIHIKFTNPLLMDEFVEKMADNEIYDLVKVDYYAAELEQIKKNLASRAAALVLEKLKNAELLTGKSFSSEDRSFSEQYQVFLPTEMYKSYQAYQSNSLQLTRPSNVNTETKTTTLFYQPVLAKEFDFVVNPVVLEPVIQVLYEVKISVIRKKESKSDKQYFILTPAGELKNISIQP